MSNRLRHRSRHRHNTGQAVSGPAPLWRRLAALFYDSILAVALMIVTTAVYHAVINNRLLGRSEAVPGFNPWLAFLLLVVLFCFFCWCWRRGGQTLGMQAWNLRLRSPGGAVPSRMQCLLRFLAAILSLVPGGAGIWWMLIDRNKKMWHDHLSRTEVLYPSQGIAPKNTP